MKKTLLFIMFCFCSMAIFAQKTCRIPEGISQTKAFSILQKAVSTTARKDLGFQNLYPDSATGTATTEVRIFKLKRKTPRIGTFPDLHRPKWRKEKIQLSASLKDRRVTISLIASAYNRRGKKWYPVHSTGRYEDAILESFLTELLPGISGMVIGSPTAVGKGGQVKLLNLQPFTITGAYLSLQDIKSLTVDLSTRQGKTYKLSIPFLGPVDNICKAEKTFFSKFTVHDLKAGVPPAYDFYWIYAIHGEIVDGMHQNQVLTALGKPDSRHVIGNDREEWLYQSGSHVRSIKFIKGDLKIPENIKE